jgi:hypothetical protein
MAGVATSAGLRSATWLMGLVLAGALLPVVATPVRGGQPYILASSATYQVEPGARLATVNVSLTFRNTTPDLPGTRSQFSSVPLNLQPGATRVTAADSAGVLRVKVAKGERVTLATISLRTPLRFNQTLALRLSYRMADGATPEIRVRPGVVVLPIWSFGTSGSVAVRLPAGFDTNVTGDELKATGGRGQSVLRSGAIGHPATWEALVSAIRGIEYVTSGRHVALSGGTVDLRVRAWRDDAPWGTATLNLATRAISALQQAIGLPIGGGQVVLTESVPTGIGSFAEPTFGAQEIGVAFDARPFTVLHQLAHLWLGNVVASERWVREGLASHAAAAIAGDLKIAVPYDPAAESAARASSRVPLAQWGTQAAVDATARATDAWAYAASWEVMDRVATLIGDDGLRTVLQRAAEGMSPYDPRDPSALEPGASVGQPLDSRQFLDQVEQVAGAPLPAKVVNAIFGSTSTDLLRTRRAARSAYGALVKAATGWGAPRPVTDALSEWRFDKAQQAMVTARTWLAQRDALMAKARAVGLSTPDRLAAAWREDGGSRGAMAELSAERSVVDAYSEAHASVRDPNPVEWLGMWGGPQPRELVSTAAGLFASGDLRGAVEALERSSRLGSDAQAAGVVRLAALAATVAVVAATIAFIVFRISMWSSGRRSRRAQAGVPPFE